MRKTQALLEERRRADVVPAEAGRTLQDKSGSGCGLHPDAASGTSLHVVPGVPFPRQPTVTVLDRVGAPVPNATVTAFASEHLNFFQQFLKLKQQQQQQFVVLRRRRKQYLQFGHQRTSR